MPVGEHEVRAIVLDLIESFYNQISQENYSADIAASFKKFLAYLEKNFVASSAKFDAKFWANVNFYSSQELERESTNNCSLGFSFLVCFLFCFFSLFFN